MQMRSFFEENDVLSGEVQQVHHDGGVNIQTRNLKYGKLKNGILIEVNHNLIKKMKHHFFELIPDLKTIIGMNGVIWVYYSTVKLDNEYFSDDQNNLIVHNKLETPTEFASINIILFKNIIKALESNKLQIDQFTIMKFYELYIELIEKHATASNVKLPEQELLKSKIVIQKENEREVVKKLKALIQANVKTGNIVDLGKEVESLRKMAEMNEESGEEEN
jgi:exosome complex component RRP4